MTTRPLASTKCPGGILSTEAFYFLQFYNEQDVTFLGLIANPRIWSNRLTVADFLAAIVNFGIEWDRRNRETGRLAAEEQRRAAQEQRRVEEKQRRAEAERAERDRRAATEEQAARRVTVEIERDLAFLSYLLDPSAENQRSLSQVIDLLSEYRDTLV